MSLTLQEVQREIASLRAEIDTRLGALLQRLHEGPPPEPGAPFRGRPIEARFNSTCPVCKQPIAKGAAAVYNDDLRQCAHLGCGVPETRGHR